MKKYSKVFFEEYVENGWKKPSDGFYYEVLGDKDDILTLKRHIIEKKPIIETCSIIQGDFLNYNRLKGFFNFFNENEVIVLGGDERNFFKEVRLERFSYCTVFELDLNFDNYKIFEIKLEYVGLSDAKEAKIPESKDVLKVGDEIILKIDRRRYANYIVKEFKNMPRKS